MQENWKIKLPARTQVYYLLRFTVKLMYCWYFL